MIFQKLVNVDRLTQEIRQSSITTALDCINAAGTNCDVVFKGTLSTADTTTLNFIVSIHVPVPLPSGAQNVNVINGKVTPSGRTEVSIFEPEGSSATLASHDFCNKTSWWGTSLPIVLETLTSVSSTVYSTSKQYIVNMTNGNVYDEDSLTAADPTLVPTVYVGGVLQSPSTYTINYVTGMITFATAPSGAVTASYKYAVSSYFIIQPRAGQILSIKNAQCQFTSDIKITSTVVFEAWYNHPTYSWVPVPGTRVTYKNEKDFVTACNGGQSTVQPWGNFQFQTIILAFDYARPKPLKSSSNVQIRIYLNDHKPLSGTFANATFYVTTEPEAV